MQVFQSVELKQQGHGTIRHRMPPQEQALYFVAPEVREGLREQLVGDGRVTIHKVDHRTIVLHGYAAVLRERINVLIEVVATTRQTKCERDTNRYQRRPGSRQSSRLHKGFSVNAWGSAG